MAGPPPGSVPTLPNIAKLMPTQAAGWRPFLALSHGAAVLAMSAGEAAMIRPFPPFGDGGRPPISRLMTANGRREPSGAPCSFEQMHGATPRTDRSAPAGSRRPFALPEPLPPFANGADQPITPFANGRPPPSPPFGNGRSP